MISPDFYRNRNSSFYILPSVFNTDLDRGFSVIDYTLNEELADKKDLEALEELGINLKLDFILNHASVLSRQFQDILKNGDDSKYRDFFIDWNKFWEGKGTMTEEGYIQPDQELIIEFDRERCVWKFKKAETELWKQPPNPLLEAINNFLTEDKPEWEGTATELVSQLPDMQIQANVLSRKLNVVNSQLLNNYGIFYDNKRGHERKIVLKRLEPRE